MIETIDFSDPNNIIVTVSGSGDYLFSLDGGPFQASGTFENVSLGIHTIQVIDTNGCAQVVRTVIVVDAPKFFTPNNDSKNDFWQVKGISNQFQANSSILIFDRFGKLLKELDPLGPGWDGTYNGAKMPTSDYWFKVKLEDGRTFTSHFTLKR